jgi:hypothetical protein
MEGHMVETKKPAKTTSKQPVKSPPKKASRAPSKKPATRPASRHIRAEGLPASKLIDARVKELDDWRGKTLERMRKLIRKADPEIVEEWKWMGTPVFSHNGDVCTGESYKSVVKLTFAKGASLKDPARLFNSSLEGNVRRAIDIHENEKIDEAAFIDLVRAAVALNLERTPARRARKA